ncbi:MAG: NAD(P)/FAD-dependent oxidoreductase [Candidatus Methanoperedens sp.]|nr:NAD(P)/FAD-dependent oxidoreductase [Candidatus Methanoperedens sp.]
MAKDMLEKGAIVQRDEKTFAVAPHIPGGIIDAAGLRKIADVAEKYNAGALKLTSAQRIAIVGIKQEDLDNVWADLQMKPAHALGLCVRSVKICPGTTFCKKGQQDSVGMGLKLDKKYDGLELPSKLKIGVSGCLNSCSEHIIKDIGIVGTPKGWKITVGGSAGLKPRLGETLGENLSDEEVLETVDRVIEYYKRHSRKKRLGEFIDEIGFEKFKAEIQ